MKVHGIIYDSSELPTNMDELSLDREMTGLLMKLISARKKTWYFITNENRWQSIHSGQ